MYEEDQEDDGDMVYVVSDIYKFVDQTRKIVFGCFGEQDEITDENMDGLISQLSETDIEELDKTLSHEECMVILHTHVNQKQREGIERNTSLHKKSLMILLKTLMLGLSAIY